MSLALEQVSVGYPDRPTVLREVDLVCPAGAVTCVIGPNASGKSTLLRTGAGLLAPTGGRVTVDGTEVRSIPVRARASRIAFMSQRPMLGASFSLRELVALGRFAIGRDDDAVDRWIRAVGLWEECARPFGVLSMGQQQRAALARAMAQLDRARDPSSATGRVLLADEPCAAMDPRHVARTIELLREGARGGITVVVSLHEMTQVRVLADHVVLLDAHGGVAASGPASSVVTPEVLEPVYGIPFRTLSDGAGDGGSVVLPRLSGSSASDA